MTHRRPVATKARSMKARRIGIRAFIDRAFVEKAATVGKISVCQAESNKIKTRDVRNGTNGFASSMYSCIKDQACLSRGSSTSRGSGLLLNLNGNKTLVAAARQAA